MIMLQYGLKNILFAREKHDFKNSPHEFKHGAKHEKKENTKSTSNLTVNFEGGEQASKTKHLRTDSAKLCYLHTRSSILEKTRKRFKKIRIFTL